MKKLLNLVFISFFIFNLTHAGVKIKGHEYWSNEKDGPTNVRDALSFVHDLVLKNTPKGAAYVYPEFSGIWYSQSLGFVAINQTSFNSKIFKMRLIKAPKGMGYNSFFKEEQILDAYKSIKDHEGSIEGTIIQEGQNFIGYNKTWFIDKDGSYKYQTNKGKISFNSSYQFVYQREAYTGIDGKANPSERDIFNKISPRGYDIIEVLKKIDSSKEISDFEIESGGMGLLIYFDSKYDDSTKSLKQNFINIGQDYSNSAGKMVRNSENKNKNSIEYIQCLNTGLFYFPKNVDGTPQTSKKYKNTCDPLKINYSTYKKYKFKYKFKGYFDWYNKNKSLLGLSFAGLIIALILFYITRQRRKVELSDYNKKNKTKFKNYSEYQKHLQKIEDIRWEKDQKEQEKERKAQAAKRKADEAKRLKEEERLEAEERRKERLEQEDDSPEENDSSLSGKVKRLRYLYKNGTLTKNEFEQAKNKLLK